MPSRIEIARVLCLWAALLFDAARAPLPLSGTPLASSIARTHRGLISAFGKHLINNGPVSKEMGRLLNRAEEIRLVADYTGDAVELSDAHEIV